MGLKSKETMIDFQPRIQGSVDLGAPPARHLMANLRVLSPPWKLGGTFSRTASTAVPFVSSEKYAYAFLNLWRVSIPSSEGLLMSWRHGRQI